MQHRDGTAELFSEQPKACRTCGQCSAASPADFLGPASEQIAVRLHLPATSLIRIAFGLYGIPMAGFVAGAQLAGIAGFGDIGALCGALAGTALAIAANRRRTEKLEHEAVTHMRAVPRESLTRR